MGKKMTHQLHEVGLEASSADSVAQAAEYVRMILPLMAQHHITANPRNFAIWYEYMSGRNQSLKDEVDHILKRDGTFSPEITTELTQRYITPCDTSALEQVNGHLTSVVDHALDEVADAGRQADASGHHLVRQARQIELNADDLDVQAVLNDVLQETHRLADTSRALKSHLDETSREMSELRQELETVRESAQRDALTGALRRDVFEQELSRRVEEAEKENTPLETLLLSLDGFSAFNERYGHLVGDKVLRFTTTLIRKHLSPQATIGRYGGDEFALILPHTDLDAALEIADRITASIRGTRLKRKDTGRALDAITATMAICGYRPGESAEICLQRLEITLLSARERGPGRTLSDVQLGEQLTLDEQPHQEQGAANGPL